MNERRKQQIARNTIAIRMEVVDRQPEIVFPELVKVPTKVEDRFKRKTYH